MNSFIFNCPTRVMFAEHESASIASYAEDMGIIKPLLVSDRGLVENGVLEPVIESLTDSGIPYETFYEVPPDSDIDCVNKAAEFARDKECNSIIAVGGGSVLDTAKVVNLCLNQGSDLLANQGLNILHER
ncbi:MAG: iron-containing alcohol dehydrogenase, partial [Cyanobacteria bacterium HKST-UBA01]|nr:iron-containing alcohol dehydrogenase [Cyanobacteria bacterium HKST-UBA01]